jgi:hypothetical protein
VEVENEKHLALLNGPQHFFPDRAAAEGHAISLAVQWCDEHVLEVAQLSDRKDKSGP